jgi:hypothetical protein
VNGAGKHNNRKDHGAGTGIYAYFLPPGHPLFPKPFNPGTEQGLGHNPPVEPGGAFEKAKRSEQQKGGRRQNRNNYPDKAKRQKKKTGNYK